MLSEEDKAMARMHVSTKGFMPIWKAAVMPKDGETVQLLYMDINDKLRFTTATYSQKAGGRFFQKSNGKLLYSYVAYRSEPERQNEPQYEWLNKSGRKKSYLRECSACGHEAYMIGVTYPLCPYCGARMKGESK